MQKLQFVLGQYFTLRGRYNNPLLKMVEFVSTTFQHHTSMAFSKSLKSTIESFTKQYDTVWTNPIDITFGASLREESTTKRCVPFRYATEKLDAIVRRPRRPHDVPNQTYLRHDLKQPTTTTVPAVVTIRSAIISNPPSLYLPLCTMDFFRVAKLPSEVTIPFGRPWSSEDSV